MLELQPGTMPAKTLLNLTARNNFYEKYVLSNTENSARKNVGNNYNDAAYVTLSRAGASEDMH